MKQIIVAILYLQQISKIKFQKNVLTVLAI